MLLQRIHPTLKNLFAFGVHGWLVNLLQVLFEGELARVAALFEAGERFLFIFRRGRQANENMPRIAFLASALVASSLAGWLWKEFGAATALSFSAGTAMIASLILLSWKENKNFHN